MQMEAMYIFMHQIQKLILIINTLLEQDLLIYHLDHGAVEAHLK